MRVVINASNLKVGGGVQVAASFLDELGHLATDPDVSGRFPWLGDQVVVVASKQVLADIHPTTRTTLPIVERTRTFDLPAFTRRRADVSFCIFGPEYIPGRSKHRIVGFADVTSLYPELVPRCNSDHGRLRPRVRRALSRMLFSRVDTLVVEAEHVADDLEARWGVDRGAISVVPNTYHAAFDNPTSWHPSPLGKKNSALHILYVARGYPHKNIGVLGEVGRELRARGAEVQFVLTVSDAEWANLPLEVRRRATNVGPVSVYQLGDLYRQCDAAIFPSLLEAFSATPLEALVTGTPLVASDRVFVRQLATDVPYYAQPDNPVALARAILEATAEGRGPRTARGIRVAQSWPSARSRALAYVQLIDSAISEVGKGGAPLSASQGRVTRPCTSTDADVVRLG